MYYYRIFIKLKDSVVITQDVSKDMLDINDIKKQIRNENKIICFGTIGIKFDNIDYYTIAPIEIN